MNCLVDHRPYAAVHGAVQTKWASFLKSAKIFATLSEKAVKHRLEETNHPKTVAGLPFESETWEHCYPRCV